MILDILDDLILSLDDLIIKFEIKLELDRTKTRSHSDNLSSVPKNKNLRKILLRYHFD